MDNNKTLVSISGILAITIVILIAITLEYHSSKNEVISKTIIESKADPLTIKAAFNGISQTDLIFKGLSNSKK